MQCLRRQDIITGNGYALSLIAPFKTMNSRVGRILGSNSNNVISFFHPRYLCPNIVIEHK